FYNGLLLGAVGALVAQHNLAIPFWGFVFPHGSLELPAIFLAGAAGLLIAKGLLWPGPYRRGYALKQQAIAAAQLVFGIVPLLIIAGIIEGFISPAPWIPDGLKYLLGTAFFLLLLSYGSRQK
ncbi:stage II sporulation protein M, partial [Synechocystis sp. LEGE 06083]|uniref:stage II sporulation protein M n=1 Tax=Synechocystis sp. LEGE 06083 TaxID=915336 RepID=UPI001881ACBA